ncbi:DUF917 domain-containing protein [Brevibacterium sp. UCMA 11754]|uniref:DUF917 domain-containing protein n=1 Tax=Brevibacterium sp. UCMA 11754 TaxID=2749198 RepID=UPI001F260043|nr:DUF917 domain-containing protein [Brevibacterium sp. UCMA 11754]MCF2574473.1 DUF917 domain-containing protein [Brevibacterium sp. UCMA 11754]
MKHAWIDESDVDSLATGAAVLGTGGGGDPHVGSLIAKRLIRKNGPVPLLPLSEVKDEDFIVPIGGIGAPSISVERIMSESELDMALDAITEATDRTPTAIMPIEVGGGNSMIPVAAAAMRGLPIVDADAMGRAFPEAPMVTFHLAGYSPGATVLVDAHGNIVVSRPSDGAWSERLARAVTVEMGGAATMIDYAYGGAVVRECAIAGTLTMAHRIGEILLGRDAGIREHRRIDALCSDLRAVRLFEGKIVELDRRIEGGFTRGTTRLDGIGVDRGADCRLEFQNEILLARRNGALAAVTPDLIAVLDHTTGLPITTESLKYGLRAVVIGIPCDLKWRTQMGIATAGPEHFGYDVVWRPVEEIASAREAVA